MKVTGAGAVGLFVLAALLSQAPEGMACTCLGEWPSLRQTMRKLPLAATAEVLAQGRLERARLYTDLDVAYLDVRIIKKVHGTEQRQTIRLWDPMVGSSCSLDLRPFSPGSYIAFAAEPPSPESKELFEALGINPAADDYLLRGCGTYYERLDSLEAAQHFPKKSKRP